MVKVKICGITNINDAKAAVNAGADFLGFVFYKKSPRYITPESALKIIDNIPSEIKKVALFVNEERDAVVKTLALIKQIDLLQFHGDEAPDYCKSFDKTIIKAVRVKNSDSINELALFDVDFFLMDSYKHNLYGGTGSSFDWQLVNSAKVFKKPIILSGGLRPENVSDAIRVTDPYAVDVSSGVEASPGVKDRDLIKKFIDNAKKTTSF